MKDYKAETYGESHAESYDDWHGMNADEAVERLAGLACGGRALELGVGTGRVAIPLAAAGVEVHGIDASPAMVERLRAKPGGERVRVGIGDFADVAAEGEFSLVFVVFNTFFMLLTQEEQVRCFRNAAARLAPGGVFVIEAFFPDVKRYDGGQIVRTISIADDEVVLEVSRHDAASQRVTTQRVVLGGGGGGVRLFPIQIRYAWPTELDLMARLAGLKLRARWGGWRREPFDSGSAKHVSVYERAE
jgi:SAM-dependent methyltransferase